VPSTWIWNVLKAAQFRPIQLSPRVHRIFLENVIGEGDGGNTIGMLVDRVQFNGTVVGEESGDQRSYILE
jgi:hypothetical protein